MGKSLSNNGSWPRGVTVLCMFEPWCQAGEGIEQSHFAISYPGGQFPDLRLPAAVLSPTSRLVE